VCIALSDTYARTHASNSKVSSEFSAPVVFYRISYVNCIYGKVIIFGKKLCTSFFSVLYEWQEGSHFIGVAALCCLYVPENWPLLVTYGLALYYLHSRVIDRHEM